MVDLTPNQITAVVVPQPGPIAVLPVPGIPGPPGPAGDDAGAITEIVDAALMSHVNDPTPHPAYDDIPDLVLLFENGLI